MKVHIELNHEDVKTAVVEYIKARHGVVIKEENLVSIDASGDEVTSEDEGFFAYVDSDYLIAKIMEN